MERELPEFEMDFEFRSEEDVVGSETSVRVHYLLANSNYTLKNVGIFQKDCSIEGTNFSMPQLKSAASPKAIFSNSEYPIMPQLFRNAFRK
jgi:hypothetical protein